jgi:MFS family permease
MASSRSNAELDQDELMQDGAGESSYLLGRNTKDPVKEAKYSELAVFLVFFFPALGGLLFGYDIGATSAVMVQLKDSSLNGVAWGSAVINSTALQGLITSFGMVGALIGSFITFNVADTIGRRGSLLIASVVFFVGAIFEYLSGGIDSSFGLFILLLGRVVYGMACGFAMYGAPAYIGEMSPPSIRGVLVSLKEAFVVLGMVLGYSMGVIYGNTEGGWRSIYGFASIIAVAMGVGMFYLLPPSAKWLALRDRLPEACASLHFVYPHK